MLAHDFLQWSLSVETRLRISSSGDTRHASRVTIRPVPTRTSCSWDELLARGQAGRLGATKYVVIGFAFAQHSWWRSQSTVHVVCSDSGTIEHAVKERALW